MFTDNKDFYPTPQNLIDKMLDGLDWKMIHTVLEPSAGKGNIVEALKKKEDFNNRWYTTIKLNIDCIENDVNLRAVLKEKNFRVVHDDFLTYDTMKEYDLIIMNPPFSNGCKHLLKALEMQQRNGGAVICLLNAETLKNECNNERIMLNRMLEEYNADIPNGEDNTISYQSIVPLPLMRMTKLDRRNSCPLCSPHFRLKICMTHWMIHLIL